MSEKQKLRGEIKSADSAKGENKTHEVENKMKWEIKHYGEK